MQKNKIILLMVVVTCLAYGTSINYGFSQDDWYFLFISTAQNIGDVLSFFNPWNQSGFAFYRPLGTQLYYYLSRLLLGLGSAPFGMHILMLLIQSFSAYNVYRLTQKMTRDSRLAVLTGVIYATSAVHFLSLYYIAATQQLLAALFALLAINDYLDQKRVRSAIWFAFALTSKEVAIVAPIIMLLAEARMKGISIRKWKKIILNLLPLGIVGIGYAAIKIFGGLHVQSEYHLIFNGSVISTLRWYYLFGYGAPEELVAYGLPRMAVDVGKYIHDYAWQGIVTIVIPCLFATFVLIRLTLAMVGKGVARKSVGIYLAWFLLALAPVLFLENHRYPHYVDLALIPLILLALEKLSKHAQLILAAILITVSLCSLNLSERVHWTTGRAVMAERARTKLDWDTICRHNSVIFMGSENHPRELSYTLSLANGPRVICNNRALKVYYQGIDSTWPQDAYSVTVDPVFK